MARELQCKCDHGAADHDIQIGCQRCDCEQYESPAWERVSVRTADILIWLYDKFLGKRFKSRDIEEEYLMERQEVHRRLQIAILWGTVRHAGRSKGGGPGRPAKLYELTEWGERYVEWRVETDNF